MPPPQDADLRSRLAKVEQSLAEKWAGNEEMLDIRTVQSFVQTAPTDHSTSAVYRNPQTEAFCQLLGIPNRINAQCTLISSDTNHAHTESGSPGDEVARIRQAASDRKRKRAQRCVS